MKTDFENESLHFWAAKTGPMGIASVNQLIEAAGSLEGAYRMSADDKRGLLSPAAWRAIGDRLSENCEQSYENFMKTGMKFVGRDSELFPQRIRTIANAPFGFFYYGELKRGDRPACSVIGARDCSEYGRYVAKEAAAALARAGVDVISGMARGVDGVSQMAALEAGGYSVGILGSGVDVCYPTSNRALYDRLREGGCVMSSFPPGELAKPANFPIRNRYVAALSDVLLVVEARLKSGTLITVDCALEMGREVFAVPGRVTDRLSDGCNRLLDIGAGVFTSPERFTEQVLEAFKGIETRYINREVSVSSITENHLSSIRSRNEKKVSLMGEGAEKVYAALDEYPKSLDEICMKVGTDFNPLEVNLLLQDLVLSDLAKEVSYGYYSLM